MPTLELVRQEIKNFLGVNLRTDRLSLGQADLAKAINADLHTVVGVISRRLGHRVQTVSPILANGNIRRLAKINNVRYRIASTYFFRNTTALTSVLSSNLVSTIVPMRPLNDTKTWAFLADDAMMMKDNGTQFFNWGIEAPTSTPELTPSGSGVLSGVYSVRYSFVRTTTGSSTAPVVSESNGSTVSPDVTVSNGSLFVSRLNSSATPDPQIAIMRLYRTVANGQTHLLEFEFPALAGSLLYDYTYTHAWEAAEIAGNVEYKMGTLYTNVIYLFDWERRHFEAMTTFVQSDSVTSNPHVGVLMSLKDSLLGEPLDLDNDPPPLASWAVEYMNHMFLVRDAANPHYLWWSKRLKPESFPLDNFLEIGNPNEPLQAAVPVAGALGVWSTTTKYRVIGNSTSGFNAYEAVSRRGTRAMNAIVPTEYGAIFAARDGIFQTNLVLKDECLSDFVEPLFYGTEPINGIPAVNWATPRQMGMIVYRNRLYFAYSGTNEVLPKHMMVYSFETKQWYFYRLSARCFYIEEDLDDLLAGGLNGYVKIIEDGDTESNLDDSEVGTDIDMEIETRDNFGEEGVERYRRKLYQFIRIDCDTDDEVVTFKFIVDGTVKFTKAYTSARGRELINLPPAVMGYSWRMNATYSGLGHPKIYSFEAFYVPLEAS